MNDTDRAAMDHVEGRASTTSLDGAHTAAPTAPPGARGQESPGTTSDHRPQSVEDGRKAEPAAPAEDTAGDFTVSGASRVTFPPSREGGTAQPEGGSTRGSRPVQRSVH